MADDTPATTWDGYPPDRNSSGLPHILSDGMDETQDGTPKEFTAGWNGRAWVTPREPAEVPPERAVSLGWTYVRSMVTG